MSDNGESFTAGELLFKLHRTMVEDLRGCDHHFFEGLTLHSRQTDGKSLLYVVSLGS